MIAASVDSSAADAVAGLHAGPPRRVGARRLRPPRLRVVDRDLVDRVLAAAEEQPHEVLVELAREIHRVHLPDERQVLRIGDAAVGLHLDRAQARELEHLCPVRVLRREVVLPRRPQDRTLHGVLLGRLFEDLRNAGHSVAVAREQHEQRERHRHADQQVQHPAAFGLVTLTSGVRLVGPDALLMEDALEPGLIGRDGGRHGAGREQDRALDVRQARHVAHLVPDRLRIDERDLAVQRPVPEGSHLVARERRSTDRSLVDAFGVALAASREEADLSGGASGQVHGDDRVPGRLVPTGPDELPGQMSRVRVHVDGARDAVPEHPGPGLVLGRVAPPDWKPSVAIEWYASSGATCTSVPSSSLSAIVKSRRWSSGSSTLKYA